jgi:peroxiredoxin
VSVDKPDPYQLPAYLPVPQDDGAAAHLRGRSIPDLGLKGDDGQICNLGEVCRGKVVLYVYPATGVPGTDPIPDWDAIPGAPGCTVQALSFRQEAERFTALGYGVVGLSAQSTAEQAEFKQRVNLPFLLLSDPLLTLHDQLGLPTFSAHGRTFFKRMVLVIKAGKVTDLAYPVFPPDNAAHRALEMIGHLG